VKIVCMIPARLGSKRVKKKNLRLINGKPLIGYIIDTVKQCDCFDEIYLNSEAMIFKEIADQHCISFYKRPAEYSTDQSTNDEFALDLFVFLTGENTMILDGSDLDRDVQESKRNGYIELSGNLRGKTKGGSRVSLMECKETDTPSVIHISNTDSSMIILEGSSKALQSPKGSNCEWEEVSFQVPLQSQLTCLAVQQILDTGASDLPTLEESFALHKPMLETFNQHLEKYTGQHYERIPIT